MTEDVNEELQGINDYEEEKYKDNPEGKFEVLYLNSSHVKTGDQEVTNQVGELDHEDLPEDLSKDMWAPESDEQEVWQCLIILYCDFASLAG